jgi:hypothetical protein
LYGFIGVDFAVFVALCAALLAVPAVALAGVLEVVLVVAPGVVPPGFVSARTD